MHNILKNLLKPKEARGQAQRASSSFIPYLQQQQPYQPGQAIPLQYQDLDRMRQEILVQLQQQQTQQQQKVIVDANMKEVYERLVQSGYFEQKKDEPKKPKTLDEKLDDAVEREIKTLRGG